MSTAIKRRALITLLGGAAIAPLAAHAQQRSGKPRHLGVLLPGLHESSMGNATRERLRELGYNEGGEVVFETRWAEGMPDRLEALAAELARLNPDVIIAYTTPGAIAARKATKTIPIIFLFVGDPVGTGVVASLAHPGVNATGISLLGTELSAKRLEILLEIAPKASDVAMLWNDSNSGMVLRAREAQDAATKLGVTIRSNGVHDLIDFAPVFATIERGQSNALLTLVDPFTSQHRRLIIDFAARHRLPAIYEAREFVEAGGLISYGPNLVAIERRAAEYVDRILKGTKPADLPVEQPTKIELVINLKTAKSLGIDVPPMLLARADEVIE